MTLTKADLQEEVDQLRRDLAMCSCWNREIGGRVLSIRRCIDFKDYLKSCGLEWCPPCTAQVVQEHKLAQRIARQA